MSRMLSLMRRSAGQMRYAIAGSLALACGFQIVLVGQAVTIEQSQSFGRLAAMLPAFLQRGLGSQLMELASFKGTVMFGYFHPVVCILIPLVAAYAATEPAYDVEARLVDLVLARSLPRRVLLTRSLAIALAYVAAAVLLTACGTWLGIQAFDARRYDLPSPALITQLLIHVAAVSVCFGAFGLLVGASSRRRSTAFTTCALVVVLAYLVDFLAIGWPLMKTISWLSPFAYYHALAIAAGEAHQGRDLAVLLGAAAAFTIAAYRRFATRDL